MKSSEILKNAKKLIADPAKLICATHPRYETVGPEYRKPNLPIQEKGCFCAVGTLRDPDNGYWVSSKACKAEDYLERASYEVFGHWAVGRLNDTQGYDATHIVYDRAIEMAEQDGD